LVQMRAGGTGRGRQGGKRVGWFAGETAVKHG
jgi:hypothetical protein